MSNENRKKLLLVTTTPTDPGKGSFIRVLSIIKHLSKHFDIDLIAYNSSVNDNPAVSERLDKALQGTGVTLHLTPNFLKPKLGVAKIGASRLLLDFFVVIIMLRLLFSKKYAVLHAEDFEAAAFLSVLSIFQNKAIKIYDMHNSIVDNLEISGKKAIFLTIARVIENFVVSRYDQLIVNWKMYEAFAESKKKKYFLYYDKSDLTIEPIEIPVEGKYMAYSGNFAKYQGVEDFLENYAISRCKMPIVLIGNTDNSLSEKLDMLKISDRVLLLGRLPIANSNYILQNSYLCLIPRTFGIQPGLKMIHHLMLGKVSLASDIPANQESLKDGYNAIMYKNSAELVDVLNSIEAEQIDLEKITKGVIKSQKMYKDMWSDEYFNKNYYGLEI